MSENVGGFRFLCYIEFLGDNFGDLTLSPPPGPPVCIHGNEEYFLFSTLNCLSVCSTQVRKYRIGLYLKNYSKEASNTKFFFYNFRKHIFCCAIFFYMKDNCSLVFKKFMVKSFNTKRLSIYFILFIDL